MIDQFAFTGPFEGVVPHMYWDTAGLVTAGVGFMLPNLAAARALAWTPSRDVDTDWALLQQLEKGHTADYYRRAGLSARLSDSIMRAEFYRRLGIFEKQICQAWPEFRVYPEAARVALLDMAYNLGVGGLLKFQHLRTACILQRWPDAARESHRKEKSAAYPSGISPARNQATAALFEKCALDTK